MLGEIFDDSVCRLTNTTCGINMVFKPIAQLNKSKNLFNSQKCIQRCSCVTDEYEEKDGNCIKKIGGLREQVSQKYKMSLYEFK